jgi:hypothetical protein
VTPVDVGPTYDSIGDWRFRVSVGMTAVSLLGLLCLVWRAAAGRWRLRSIRTLIDGPLRTSLDRLLTERGVRRPVRLACAAAAGEPSAGGILRWVIVVPPDIESRLNPAEQHALLAHELAHLVRRDPLWLWIGTALCWCLPFQPLNFLAVRRWRQPAEELCDDWAIAGGVKPLTLANCLTRVAEWRLSPMPVGLTADVGKSRLARRISRLVNHEAARDRWSRPARQRLLFVGALGCILLLTCCGPRMQAANRGDGEPGGVSSANGEPGSVSSAIGEPGSVSSRIDRPDDTLASAGVEPGARRVDALPTTSEVEQELAALLSDLERMEALIGNTGNDAELDAARAGMRSRIEAIRNRAGP